MRGSVPWDSAGSSFRSTVEAATSHPDPECLVLTRLFLLVCLFWIFFADKSEYLPVFLSIFSILLKARLYLKGFHICHLFPFFSKAAGVEIRPSQRPIWCLQRYIPPPNSWDAYVFRMLIPWYSPLSCGTPVLMTFLFCMDWAAKLR